MPCLRWTEALPTEQSQSSASRSTSTSASADEKKKSSACSSALPIQASSFLSRLPNHISLSDLALPGTHETLARSGWPVSQCQTRSVLQQLNGGVRFFDIRIGIKRFHSASASASALDSAHAQQSQCGATVGARAEKSESESESGRAALKVKSPLDEQRKDWRMWAFHGITDQKMDFGRVLMDVSQWLSAVGKGETVVLSLKPEGGMKVTPDEWVDFLYEAYIDPNEAWWYLKDEIPRLKDVRGRMVLFSRFGRQEGRQDRLGRWGINARRWPDGLDDVFSFHLTNPAQSVHIQDAYKMSGIMSSSTALRKVELIGTLLDKKRADAPSLALNFCNGSSFPLALPPIVARGISNPPCLRVQGMNQRLLFLLQQHLDAQSGPPPPPPTSEGKTFAAAAKRGLACIFAIDFFEADLIAQEVVRLIILANFV
ncbi:PLC-like phosphodiesterase [Ceraceosorus guamensis]|uniref:PLC-like phosphodiesterase n=1 Tax=Ceraceosorus guamensis TaxID=1522189 RepID=A0A316VTC5_9BASI|nr:PLC-like phosphodiesterase [Ceraceosorus guamensis]PWN40742.1 PLC-like phosphodiesterase [Ceraceosorus guamensis]